MSVDTAEAFYGDFYGSGTADDPYGGTIEMMYPDEMDGCYFHVGTQFVEVYSNDAPLMISYRVTAESGLTVSTDGWNDVEGTLLIPGTFQIECQQGVSDWEVVATFHSVEPTPELEFLSDPVSDGHVYWPGNLTQVGSESGQGNKWENVYDDFDPNDPGSTHWDEMW